MKKIKLVDLFCKAGGCSMGYYQAAQDLGIPIEITGVDIAPQKNYPFNFVQADAHSFIKNNLDRFTHWHASPPCQKYSRSTALNRKKSGAEYPDILPETIEIFSSSGIPGVIENVMPAPMRSDVRLRGDMFGLKVIRERKFALFNWFMMQPGHPSIRKGAVTKYGEYVSVFGNGHFKLNGQVEYKYRESSVRKTWSTAMDIDWMTCRELSEAIPPAYTRYLGGYFFRA